MAMLTVFFKGEVCHFFGIGSEICSPGVFQAKVLEIVPSVLCLQKPASPNSLCDQLLNVWLWTKTLEIHLTIFQKSCFFVC